VFGQALSRAWGERPALQSIDDGGEVCGPDGCAVPQQ
jgi:hypothetical protein